MGGHTQRLHQQSHTHGTKHPLHYSTRRSPERGLNIAQSHLRPQIPFTGGFIPLADEGCLPREASLPRARFPTALTNPSARARALRQVFARPQVSAASRPLCRADRSEVYH